MTTLKELASESPTEADLERAMEEIDDDRPRSAAVVGVTFLEDTLRIALLSQMVDLSKEETDRLFVGYAPLSSLSAKTQLAYAIGLIGPKARHDIDKLREIRNAFAHAKISVTFETNAIANAISGLHFRELAADWPKLTNQKKFASVARALMIYIISGWTTQTEIMKTIRDFDPPKSVIPVTLREK